jgi:acetolactate decarboxylase
MANLDTTIPTSLKAALDAEVTRTKRTPSSVVTAALSEYLGLPVHTLFQVSTSGALVAGVYDREVSVKSILEHGDFGLGTFANRFRVPVACRKPVPTPALRSPW